MAREFIPFKEVEALADIRQIADILGLQLKPYGQSGQLRCSCPVHGGGDDTLAISPHARSKRGSIGVFFCRKAPDPKTAGGDRIGLVAHIEQLEQQEAAYYIASHFGSEDDDSDISPTVPPAREKATTTREPTRAPFDPEAFAKEKLAYSEEVAALGFSEEDAEHFGVGFLKSKGKVYLPLRHPDGSIAAFFDYGSGRLKLPARARWLDQSAPNVIPFGKKTA
jgi:hypothetical protein